MGVRGSSQESFRYTTYGHCDFSRTFLLYSRGDFQVQIRNGIVEGILQYASA